ncbi:hypothetical protein LXL04_016096 [Taraxacum kok-saghyz]
MTVELQSIRVVIEQLHISILKLIRWLIRYCIVRTLRASLLQTVPTDILKKGKTIADAYNSPDEDFALQNLDPNLKQLESIHNSFLDSSDRTNTTILLHAKAKAKTSSRDPYGYSSVPPLHACTPSRIPLPISQHACTPFSDNGAVFNLTPLYLPSRISLRLAGQN